MTTYIAMWTKTAIAIHAGGCIHTPKKAENDWRKTNNFMGETSSLNRDEFAKYIKDLADGVIDDGVASSDNKVRISPCAK